MFGKPELDAPTYTMHYIEHCDSWQARTCVQVCYKVGPLSYKVRNRENVLVSKRNLRAFCRRHGLPIVQDDLSKLPVE